MSDPTFTRQILLALTDLSVKMAVFALATELLLRLADRRDTQLRHAAWMVVLCGMLVLPLSWLLPGLPLRLPDLPLALSAAAPAPPLPAAPAAASVPAPAPAAPLSGPAPAAPPPPSPATAVQPAAALPATAPERISWPQIAIGIYLLGLLLMASHLLLGLALRRRVLATARPIADAELFALCARISARAGLRRPVSLRVSPAVRVPLAIGSRQRLVVLPEAWSTWERGKLESVLAHELAHLRRADPRTHLLSLVNRCIYWFHPLAWAIPRQLSSLAERICDEMAVSWTGRRRGYARHLVEITAALQGRGGRVVLGGVPMAQGSDLQERVESLLVGAPRRRLSRLGRTLTVTAIAGMLLGVGAVRVEARKVRHLGSGERAAAVAALTSAEAGKRADAARKLREGRDVSPDIVPTLVRMLGDRTPVRLWLEATDPGKEAARALGEAGEISVDALLKALASGSPEVRHDAAYGLGITQSPRALQPLLAARKDAAWQVRERVAWALGCLELDEAVQALVAALADERPEVRATAAVSLGWIENAGALPALHKALNDSDQEVRSRAARAIKLIGDEHGEPVPAGTAEKVPEAQKGLRSGDYRVRGRAVEALSRLGDPASVAALITRLRDGDYRVRKEAAEALGEIGDRAAVEALAGALKDEEYRVGQMSAWALGQIGDPAAVAPLTAALRDSDDRVRAGAAEALGRIGRPQAVPGLERALKDEEAEVRMEAVRALLSIEGTQAAAALRSALKDPDPRVRRQAGLALQIVARSVTLADLETALVDDDYRIRKIAATGIERAATRKAPDALFLALREDTSTTVREIVARALGKLDDPRATPALIQALKDEHWEVRQQAAASLGLLRDPHAREALTTAKGDESPRVRASAAEALRRLGSAG